MAEKDIKLDPWGSFQIEDYSKVIKQFGIEPFDAQGLPDPPAIFRRGVIFGHRGFNSIRRAIRLKRPWAVLTGLMPSGYMHLGNKVVFDQVRYYQRLGADIFILVADIESFAARGRSFEYARNMAIEAYILNYIAMGLEPTRCQIYFQSKRQLVKDMGYMLGRKVNWAQLRAIYGFGDQTNMAHVFAPLVQVGDILHVQADHYGGPRPTVVPVGVDQDPHIRLTRDIAAAHRLFNVGETKDGRIGVFVKVDEDVPALLKEAEAVLRQLGHKNLEVMVNYKAIYVNDAEGADEIMEIDEDLVPIEKRRGGWGFLPPSSTYNRFMTGLTGGKMSSSIPQSAIFLNEKPEDARKKVMESKTGGGQTMKEHQEKGGRPEVCSVYEMLLFHFEPDDAALRKIFEDCKGGKQLCGNCKNMVADRLVAFLKDLAVKREAARGRLNDYLAKD